jgi:hypothetical protein
MIEVLFLSLATWMITSIVVEAEIFRDVREAFDKLYNRWPNWLTYKLKYLIGCHLCTGIWVAGIVALAIPPVVSSGFIGWALTALAIKGIAHVFLIAQKAVEAWTDYNRNETTHLVDMDLGDVASGHLPKQLLDEINDHHWHD